MRRRDDEPATRAGRRDDAPRPLPFARSGEPCAACGGAPVSARPHGTLLAALACAALLCALCAAPARAQQQQQQKDSCLDCHTRLEGQLGEPARTFGDDIHRARGLSCADCHGGDPAQDDKRAAKSAARGYLAGLRPREVPAFCGKCHNDAHFMKRFNPALRVDQAAEYATSVHGRRLFAGDERVATCASCHGAHGIRAVKDPLSTVYASNVAETCARCHADPPRMSGARIPTDQYAKYKSSVHARALYDRQDVSAPTCNDCHGNHGAAPPGVASVANVCGQCHARQSTLFQASPHKAAFDAMEIGECARCHNNHDIAEPSDAMLGTQAGSTCASCHREGDRGFAAAGLIRGRIDELQARIHSAEEILGRAERAGMEVSRPKFDLREAVDALTHARVVVHASSAEEVDRVAGPGLAVAAKSYDAGQAALDERRYRRKGLAVSLFFILFLAAVVYLKVRQIEGRPFFAR